jgi:hypothetical protein
LHSSTSAAARYAGVALGRIKIDAAANKHLRENHVLEASRSHLALGIEKPPVLGKLHIVLLQRYADQIGVP